MSEDGPPNNFLFNQLPGPGVKGQPRECSKGTMQTDLAELNIKNDGFIGFLKGLRGGS